MSKEPGRNELCWCGSSKKYKKCHFDRENMSPFPIQNIIDMQKSYFVGKTCLVPIQEGTLCPNPTIKSHTIQKSGSLKRIAVNSEVYNLSVDPIKKLDPFVLKKVATNQASIF